MCTINVSNAIKHTAQNEKRPLLHWQKVIGPISAAAVAAVAAYLHGHTQKNAECLFAGPG